MTLFGKHIKENQRQPKRLRTINTSKTKIIIRENHKTRIMPTCFEGGEGATYVLPVAYVMPRARTLFNGHAVGFEGGKFIVTHCLAVTQAS